MPSRLKPREQGDLGELSAMEWLASQGAKIYISVFHSPDVDLIAELEVNSFGWRSRPVTTRGRLTGGAC